MALVATDINIFMPVMKDTDGKPIAFVIGTLAFDSSYPTDGEAITVGNMREVKGLMAGKYGDWIFEYDVTNKKLKAYVMSTGLEVANGTNLSTATGIPYVAWGNP